MPNKFPIKSLIFATILLVLLSNTLFTVDQREQVLILQFGEPIRLINTPGLKFKIPFLQDLVFFDKRILDLGIKEREVIASDQKRLIIDAFTKYRIIDPLKFYTTVRDYNGINSKLSTVLDSSLRQVIGGANLSELLTENRSKLMARILENLAHESKIFGVEIIDVRIVRADLPKENSDAIFARMQTEREKEAREIRAGGAEEGDKIRATAEKDRTILLAEAKKRAEITQGEGDAQASKIYANSFGRDPEFADFYQSINAYGQALTSDKTKMIMSPDGEFFKYFATVGGQTKIPTKPTTKSAKR